MYAYIKLARYTDKEPYRADQGITLKQANQV